jgi:thioredoxin-like negative regulator of GroEL
MNAPSRREKIEAMLTEEPLNQFLRYSLAMECDKEGDHDRSLELLDTLARDSEPYVAAFFMAGQQLARLQRVSEARTYLRDGIEAARRAGDGHAAGEMSEFLASLGAAGE